MDMSLVREEDIREYIEVWLWVGNEAGESSRFCIII